MLYKLRSKHNIKSVMVEGGAGIISSFMSLSDVVRCVCITISPKLIGGEIGLSAFRSSNFSENENGMLAFCSSSALWAEVGSDCIFLAKCQKDSYE